jgi:hypothetical protein
MKPVRVRLAAGLHCAFHHDLETGMHVEWYPEIPRPMPRQIRRRYIEARDRAYRAIAKRLGGPVLVLDSENGGREIAPIMSTIHPDGQIERHTLDGGRVH